MTYAVSAQNLVKRYKELIALDHFSLNLEEGKILGLLGPNGSGKTTAINCILALTKPDKGTVDIFGSAMSPSNYAVKSKTGIVPQQIAVFKELTVRQNIDYFCGLYIKDKKTRRGCTREAIEFCELERFVKFLPEKLSGGLKRRLNIACGIAHKPKLIVLDEPTVAVDPQSREHILDGIEKLNRDGASVIYTTHYMEEAERLCDEIVIMDNGTAIAQGSPEQLKNMIRTGETVKIECAASDDNIICELKALNNIYSVRFEDGILEIRCEKGAHNLIHILHKLEEEGVPFGEVEAVKPTLNDVFLEITGRELRDSEEA